MYAAFQLQITISKLLQLSLLSTSPLNLTKVTTFSTKMLFFLISFFSFLLLSLRLIIKPNPASKIEPKMQVFLWSLGKAVLSLVVSLITKRRIFMNSLLVSPLSPSKKRILSSECEIVEEIKEGKNGVSLVDLPDLALDCILEKLSPAGLCSMVGVCSSLRERCTSDYLWEKHMKQKWGGLIGEAAYKEWQLHIASKRAPRLVHCRADQENSQLFSGLLSFFCHNSGMKARKRVLRSSLPGNSLMSCYLALESGRFWFPAQVFNRENGHVGFMLSCYDAQLSYDSTTDNFVARYPAKGRHMIEEDIDWSRIRAPTVDARAEVLHVSDCLNELKPNDHIEIQWRRNKQFPYGWWYGVVGHLESCNANELSCHCHLSDTVILEFKQYAPASRWRKAVISRKDHREVGDEADGFYGGIRKLHREEEIARWNHLWSYSTLEHPH